MDGQPAGAAPQGRCGVKARRKARRPAVDRPTNGPSGFSAGEPRDRDATNDQDARLPYRLPELIEAVGAKRTVFIVEGEAKADALREFGIAATTNPGGAGKWQPGVQRIPARRRCPCCFPTTTTPAGAM